MTFSQAIQKYLRKSCVYIWETMSKSVYDRWTSRIARTFSLILCENPLFRFERPSFFIHGNDSILLTNHKMNRNFSAALFSSNKYPSPYPRRYYCFATNPFFYSEKAPWFFRLISPHPLCNFPHHKSWTISFK